MTLIELLDRLAVPGVPSAAGASQAALGLRGRLKEGFRPVACAYEGDGGPVPRVTLLLEREHQRLSLEVAADPQVLAVLREKFPDLPVYSSSPGTPAGEHEAGGALTMELAARFRQTADLPAEERAARLMDWIMARIDAARCALIPFDDGLPGRPLAFQVRGTRPEQMDLQHVPRRIVRYVASTRQPVIRHDLAEQKDELPPQETAIRQQVRSYLAVPVVFRGDLLAVCYADRFERPRDFSEEEQAAFQAFAYELSRPLLALRDERRRGEFDAVRDGFLVAGRRRPGQAWSPAFAAVVRRAERLAPHVGENLLILGETGVGKEMLGRRIHETSGRPGPFVALNVSAIAADLFESELHGSTRGAFTGAVDRDGRIAEAEGGTLFLDEIGDLGLGNQVKLLRFLEDKRRTPVGGRATRAVDVRIVAATNRPLETLVASGEFRDDLLQRFAPPLRVPPLREREPEILPLARSFLDHRARQAGQRAPAFTRDAEDLLRRYPWPGNVRQLRSVVHHAFIMTSGEDIDREVLESLLPQRESGAGMPGTLQEWRERCAADERRWLLAVLDREGGNAEAASRRLACPASTLRLLMRKHGIATAPSAGKKDRTRGARG